MAKQFDRAAYDKQEFSGPIYKNQIVAPVARPRETLVCKNVPDLGPGVVNVLVISRDPDDTEGPWPTNNGPRVSMNVKDSHGRTNTHDVWIENHQAYAEQTHIDIQCAIPAAAYYLQPNDENS
jgi:hypothetical protein